LAIPPTFFVFLISDRYANDLKFGSETLDDLVREQEGLVVPVNLSWFTRHEDAAWQARQQLGEVNLFLFDFDYLRRAASTVDDAVELAKYLASMFCYGAACSRERVLDERTCDISVVIISDKKSKKKHVFPSFVSWVYNPFLKENYDIPISDSKLIKLIIAWAKNRTIGKGRVGDGDKRLGA